MTTLSANDIACREAAKLAAYQMLSEVVGLEDNAAKARRVGKFDAAVALDGLAGALRSGQLTRQQLHADSKRCRLFGARALDV